MRNFEKLVGDLTTEENKELLKVLAGEMKLDDIVEVLRAVLSDDDKNELGAQFTD